MKKTDPRWSLPISETAFLVCDIEATGSDARRHRIFELAIVELHRNEITPRFAQLFNPRQYIPRPISAVTGISNIHVLAAPLLEDYLPTIHRLLSTPNAVFVGHNVQFDWKFLEAALRRAGYDIPDIPRLCTYRLARRLLTRNKKFNVAALAEYFHIPATQFHRALADATATAHILQHLIALVRERYDMELLGELLSLQFKPFTVFRVSKTKKERLQPLLQQVPSLPGVYEFRDRDGTVLYVGKAKNLRDRINSYFTQGQLPKKIAEMLNNVADIQWHITETELAALLLEARKIKEYQPPYNTVAKRYRRYTYLKLHTEAEFPYLECVTTIQNDRAQYYGPFRSRRTAENLKNLLEAHFPIRRCNGQLVRGEIPRGCLDFHLKRCLAPCANLTVTAAYQTVIRQVQDFLSGKTEQLIQLFQCLLEQHSREREYEAAQRVLEQLREVQQIFASSLKHSTAIHDRNLVILQPSPSYRHKIELFLIQYGALAYQRLVGKRFPEKELARYLERFYATPSSFPPPDVNVSMLSEEIRIVTHWLNALDRTAVILPVTIPAKVPELLTAIRRHAYQLMATPPAD